MSEILVSTFEGPGSSPMIRTVPRPVVPDRAALIEIGCCGVCGTDLHILKGQWIVMRELRPMAVRKPREARTASYAAAVGPLPPILCARRSATGSLRRTRSTTWGSVSVWAAVAEHRFFELMTERENGGKSRGRPRRGEGVRGFFREDGIKTGGQPFLL
jgi:hypothetical protein